MKICILGAGSLGSAIGGALAISGNEVHFVGRKAHMEAIRENGLVMVMGSEERISRPIPHETPEGIGVCDLVIVLCKAYDTQQTIESGLSLVGPDTVVMTFQNGLGAEDILSNAVGTEHVIGGKTYVGGMLLEPGRVQATLAQKETFIGELDGSESVRVEQIVAAFNQAGMETSATTNIMGVIWDKLLVNVSTGAVCAITGLPYGGLYSQESLLEVSRAAVMEGVTVAHAAGVKLTYEDPDKVLWMAGKGLPDSFKPSLQQSLESGRRTEVDVIAGAVVREGKRLGVPTPVNYTLWACVKGIERCHEEYAN